MTSFPSALDALPNPSGTNTLAEVNHADQHINANDAIEALQAKVGVDGSAVITSHDYLISANTSAISTKVEGAGVATLTVNTTAPSSPAVGDIWVDTDDASADTVMNQATYDATGIEEQVVGLTATQTLTNKTIDGSQLVANSVDSEKLTSTVAFMATTTQSISTSLLTTVTTYTEDFDIGSNFDHTTGLFTAPYDGIYLFSATCGYNNIATSGRCITRIYVNGVWSADAQVDNNAASTDTAQCVSTTVQMTAGQTAYMSTYQSDGTTLALRDPSNFSGHLVGRTD